MTASRTAFVALAAALALSACKPGAGAGGGGAAGPGATPPDPTEAFVSDPQRAEAYTALKRLFPEDYARIRAELDAMIKGGKPEAEVKARAFALWREFSTTHREATTAAPTAVLFQLAQKNRDLMAVLQRDNVEACAQIARNKFESDAGLTPASMAALSASSAAQLEATKAGMATPTPRSGEMEEATLTAFGDALKRENLREAAVQAVFADEAENPPAADVCEGGAGLSRVIASLPPEHAARLQAFALDAILKPKKPAAG